MTTHTTGGRAGLIAAALTLLAGCGSPRLPPAPAALTIGVTIYSDINYDGDSAHLTADIPDLRKLSSGCAEVDTQDDAEFTAGSQTWTNCISSLGVAPGWKAVLYAGKQFRGTRFEVAASLRDLRGAAGPCRGTLNDCVSSIQVVRTTRPD